MVTNSRALDERIGGASEFAELSIADGENRHAGDAEHEHADGTDLVDRADFKGGVDASHVAITATHPCCSNLFIQQKK